MGTETLVLNTNDTYEQKFTDSHGFTMTNRGTWSFYRSDGQSRISLNEFKFYISASADDKVEYNPEPQIFDTVATNNFGVITIDINYDLAWYYEKSKP